jgi:hypothetical protein
MLIAEPAARAIELLDRAECLLDERSLNPAWQSFINAESAGADPDRCSAGRWQVAMLNGDFESAWKESDAIRARGPHPDSFWSGENIEDKHVIVRCVHGFGDAVQMLRYAPSLAARAAHVVYEVDPRLLPLMRCFNGVAHAITWNDQSPEWDVQIEIMELPHFFRTTMSELPLAENYLKIPESDLQLAANSLGPRQRPRVGIVWTCGDWNPSRNVPPLALAGLAALDVEFWNLESWSSSIECSELEMRDARRFTDGLLPLAAVIANLDFVITPDTLAAHLAGVLGKPACVMLQYAADWRWAVERNDSPWYPSLRLFRQPAPGDWLSVIESIRASLQSFVS